VFLTSIKDAECDVVLDYAPRLAAMDAVVFLHGKLRPPNSGGLFFSLVRSAGGARVVALPIPRLAPFWWSLGYWVYSRFLGR
jgi:hypothetical protein